MPQHHDEDSDEEDGHILYRDDDDEPEEEGKPCLVFCFKHVKLIINFASDKMKLY